MAFSFSITPYTSDTSLTNFFPLPRDLISTDLPSTALLIYAALLDRATLSQKNSFADNSGWIYVIYTIEHLATTFDLSDTSVKKHLRALEEHRLICRQREAKNGANKIYLRIPTSSAKVTPSGTKTTGKSPKTSPSAGRNVPSNNLNQPQNLSDYYRHGEGDSL